MQGTILQINISPGGVPKRPVPEAEVTPLGLAGDRHAHPAVHGGPLKAVLLIASEVVDSLAARGFPVFHGALGENLTTGGIDVARIRIGDRIRAGGAVLEITQPRIPCSALDVYGPGIQQEIYDKQVKALDPSSPRWGMSGFYARVLVPGYVRTGDIIAVEAMLA
jgi:MOSC domain-containing protein YiiM